LTAISGDLGVQRGILEGIMKDQKLQSDLVRNEALFKTTIHVATRNPLLLEIVITSDTLKPEIIECLRLDEGVLTNALKHEPIRRRLLKWLIEGEFKTLEKQILRNGTLIEAAELLLELDDEDYERFLQTEDRGQSIIPTFLSAFIRGARHPNKFKFRIPRIRRCLHAEPMLLWDFINDKHYTTPTIDAVAEFSDLSGFLVDAIPKNFSSPEDESLVLKLLTGLRSKNEIHDELE
jgi:hypothetical protein